MHWLRALQDMDMPAHVARVPVLELGGRKPFEWTRVACWVYCGTVRTHDTNGAATSFSSSHVLFGTHPLHSTLTRFALRRRILTFFVCFLFLLPPPLHMALCAFTL